MTQRESDLMLYGNYFEYGGQRLDPLSMEIEESASYFAERNPYYIVKYHYRLPSGQYIHFSPKDIVHKTQ